VDDGTWALVGPYSNGQPFLAGWDPSLGYVSRADGKLTLRVERKEFYDYSQTGGGGGTRYPFSSAEIRSHQYYGIGCYSTCMRPSGVSGVSSSFYAMSGHFDTPRDAGRDKNEIHNEIDIEFVGKSGRLMQTNFFSRWKDPYANSASGHEMLHDLGFDATQVYAAYEFKWTRSYVAWFVNGRPVRVVWAHEVDLPSPDYTTLRIAANAWPVNKQAEEWAGPLPPNLEATEAKYSYMAFEEGEDCRPRGQC
jgi:endo-1,3-1,4-beta-glycanase ExoK